MCIAASLFSDRAGRVALAGGRDTVAAAFLRVVLVVGLFLGVAALLVAGFRVGLFRAGVFLAGSFLVAAPSEAGFFAALLVAARLVTASEEVFLVEVFFAADLAGAFCALEPSALLPG
ncbi:MAG: hypothetical protein H0V77_03925 [Actinobacteria bacterium]|nr:hypothetical protein [Actinomycetota bacterium]